MTILAERVEVVEDRLDRLEALVDRFIEAVDRDREQAARDREEAARARDQDREQAARYREEAARARERDQEQAARYREEAARARERDQEQAARYREEAARERREMNKRWGELANKMGTIVEDIVAPSVRRMAGALFECGDEELFTPRLSRIRSDDRSRRREFDALYVGTRAVLLNETMSSPRSRDARAFVDFLRSGEFALYFPEYRERPVVPVFSSLSLPDDLVTYLTRHGVYALAMGDEAMRVLNFDAVRSRRSAAR